jgi:hypothetical protein
MIILSRLVGGFFRPRKISRAQKTMNSFFVFCLQIEQECRYSDIPIAIGIGIGIGITPAIQPK